MAAETRGTSGQRQWEGYGGPIQQERPNLNGIDPTLDSCCQREEEEHIRQSALTRTLQRFDIAKQRERQRKNLVAVTSSSVFEGCRCCYDPDSDGGMYRALIELREELGNAGDNHIHDAANDEEEQEEDPAISAKATSETSSANSDDEFDYLLDEIDLLPEGQELQEQRRAELEFEVLHREIARQHGFGVHRQMHPHRVLKAALQAPCVVLHLVDPDSTASATLDVFLEDSAAPKYAGTKFLRSGGRSTLLLDRELVAKYLPRLKPDCDLPALVAFRDGVAIAYCPRLQGLTSCGSENARIIPSVVLEWLDRTGVLLSQIPMLEELCRIRPEEEALLDSMYVANKATRAKHEEQRYDCGLQGCMKSFPHEHIGEKTAQQDGLVVPESSILVDELTSAE